MPWRELKSSKREVIPGGRGVTTRGNQEEWEEKRESFGSGREGIRRRPGSIIRAWETRSDGAGKGRQPRRPRRDAPA